MRNLISSIQQKDIRILYIFNRNFKCRLLDLLMPYITQLGSLGFSIALPALMLFYKKDSLRVVGFELLIALTSSSIIVQVVKKAVNRPRPWIVLENVHSYGIPLYHYSFPSGHTTAAFAMAWVLSLSFAALIPLFVILAFMVGISRMYLGVHYPTDVLIGSIIGSASAGVTHMMMF